MSSTIRKRGRYGISLSTNYRPCGSNTHFSYSIWHLIWHPGRWTEGEFDALPRTYIPAFTLAEDNSNTGWTARSGLLNLKLLNASYQQAQVHPVFSSAPLIAKLYEPKIVQCSPLHKDRAWQPKWQQSRRSSAWDGGFLRTKITANTRVEEHWRLSKKNKIVVDIAQKGLLGVYNPRGHK